MDNQITFYPEKEIYRKFKAALLLSGEEEETVLTKLISKYVHEVFSDVIGKNTAEDLRIAEKSSVAAASRMFTGVRILCPS